MRYFRFESLVAVTALCASIACVPALAQTQQVQSQKHQQQQPQAQPKTQPQPKSQGPTITIVGTTPTQEDMGNLAWAAGPSGKDLPQGSGTAKQGAEIFQAKCAMCHGQDAHGVQGQPGAFSPIGGLPLTGPKAEAPHNPWIPPITSGAPFPEVIFNTIAVEMPMFRPGTLKADEVYSLAAFIFFKNGLIKQDEVMNSETLAQIQMPNRKYFPASDDVYMDQKKRGCYQTHGVCLGD
jgi:mono/diheme cytochrome c family protein